MALTGKLEADFSSFFDAATKAIASLFGIETAAGKAGGALNAMATEMGGVALGMLGASSAEAVLEKGLEFLKGSFEAFTEAEQNVRHLTAALELTGNATTEVIGQFKELADAYEQSTIYSEDMIVAAEKTFTLIGHVAPEQMDKALQAATNLASGLGIDLQSAVTMLSKAAEGNVTALHRYGVEIDAAAVKAHGAEAAFDAVNAKFSGQAQADMETTAGKIAQLSHEWEHFKEGTGEVIVDLGRIVGALGNTEDSTSKVIPKIDGATYALKQQKEPLDDATKGWVAYLTTISHYGSYLDPTKLAQEITNGMRQVDDAIKAAAPNLPAFTLPKPDFDALVKGARSYATELALAEERYHELTPDVINNLGAAFKLGTASVADLVQQTGLSAEVISVAKKAWQDHNEELKKGEEAAKKFAEAQAAIRAAYVPLTEAQQAAAVSNEAVGLSAEQTAKAFGISGAAVKAYLDSLKYGQQIADMWIKLHDEMARATHKLTVSATVDFNKQQEQIAQASVAGLDKLLSTTAEYQTKNAELTMDGTTKTIAEIDRANDAAVKSAAKLATAFGATLGVEARAQIDAFYQHQRDVALQTADTLDERMRAQGIFTRAELEDQALDAENAYQQMAASGNYSAAQIEAAAKRAKDAWKKASSDVMTSWHDAMTNMIGGLSELGNAIGGTFGKLTSAASSAFKSATSGAANLASGLFSLSHGDILGGISGVISGVSGIASAAVTAGKAIGGLISNLFGLGSKGRDAVVAFANSMGGFDALHEKLNALGAEGEQLWIKLTQGVGKNNPTEAQAAIKAVTDALAKQQAASQDTQVQTEEQAAATIETATQASQALDTVTEKLKSNADDWRTWGDAVNGVINAVGAAVRAMPTPSAPSAVPGFATGTGGKFLDFGSGTLAMLHGRERVMTPGEGGGGGGGTAVIQIEGRTLAEIVVPEMPGVIRRYGLA